MRQKWCHVELAGRSTYQSRRVQGWSDPWWRLPPITVDSTVTHSGKQNRAWIKSPSFAIIINVQEQMLLLYILGKTAGVKIFVASWCKKWGENFSQCHRNNDQGQDLKDPVRLCFLFQQTFSRKSIVPLCIGVELFSLCTLFFEGLSSLLTSPLSWPYINSSFFCGVPPASLHFSSVRPSGFHWIIRLTWPDTFQFQRQYRKGSRYCQKCWCRSWWVGPG